MDKKFTAILLSILLLVIGGTAMADHDSYTGNSANAMNAKTMGYKQCQHLYGKQGSTPDQAKLKACMKKARHAHKRANQAKQNMQQCRQYAPGSEEFKNCMHHDHDMMQQDPDHDHDSKSNDYDNDNE